MKSRKCLGKTDESLILDTHIALWVLLDSEELPIEARNLITGKM